jgi:signal transduction histidine kinase
MPFPAEELHRNPGTISRARHDDDRQCLASQRCLQWVEGRIEVEQHREPLGNDMKRRLGWIVLALSGAFVVPVLANEPIRVGVYSNEPKVFVDSQGHVRGFFVDILNYIAEKEGWQIVYVPDTWQNNLTKLARGDIDLLLDIAESAKRSELFDFNRESVFSNWAIVYVQEHSRIQSISDLNGKTLAAMKGDISYEEFRTTVEGLNIYCDFVEVDEFRQVLELVANKQVDAGIVSRLFGLRNERDYRVRRTTIICCPNNLYFGVAKNRNRHLLEKIDFQLNHLKHDDQSFYYQSLTKWIESISPWKVPVWLKWVMALGALGLVLSAVAMVLLKFQVNARTAELREKNQQLERARSDLTVRNEALKKEIVERQRAEEETRSLQRHLVQAQKMEAMGTLAGGLAHDFNNILQAILGYAQLLDQEDDLGVPSSRISSEIKRSVLSGSRLTQQLLTFGRKVDSKPRPTDLNQEIVRARNLIERLIPQTVDLKIEPQEDLPTIYADSTQVEQILLNLVMNAGHAMPQGGKLMIRTATVLFDEESCKQYLGLTPGRYVMLEVSDTGHGIPENLQSRIFEPFFTTKEPGQGTGLGLSVVYGIVQHHHGHISCESTPGRGTTFRIYLPVAESTEKCPA